MAILEQETKENVSGFTKTIEESAMPIVLDYLQKAAYQFPEASTIRELACNAIDSTREKFRALSILRGESTVEDHYAQREGDVYKDSRFKPEYYAPQWLSEKRTISIKLVERPDQQRDLLIIEDEGVGLGGSRLSGYFRPGWSSKRLSSGAIGKWGLGSKAPLSTGVSVYTMITRHNGLENAFNIYDGNIQPIYPKMELDGRVNTLVELEDGKGGKAPSYARTTAKPNGVSIQLEVKKINKGKFIDAVKTQLMYFPEVEFFIVHDDGYEEKIKTQAEILYEDANMVLSDNSSYSKPHVLINGVNYGFIQFDQMELEDMQGNIAVKVAAEAVDITPSREHLQWSDKTREGILSVFKKVQGTAGSILKSAISEDMGVVEFLKTAAAIRSNIQGGKDKKFEILNRLGKVFHLNYEDVTLKGKSFKEYNDMSQSLDESFEMLQPSWFYKNGVDLFKTSRTQRWLQGWRELIVQLEEGKTKLYLQMMGEEGDSTKPKVDMQIITDSLRLGSRGQNYKVWKLKLREGQIKAIQTDPVLKEIFIHLRDNNLIHKYSEVEVDPENPWMKKEQKLEEEEQQKTEELKAAIKGGKSSKSVEVPVIFSGGDTYMLLNAEELQMYPVERTFWYVSTDENERYLGKFAARIANSSLSVKDGTPYHAQEVFSQFRTDLLEAGALRAALKEEPFLGNGIRYCSEFQYIPLPYIEQCMTKEPYYFIGVPKKFEKLLKKYSHITDFYHQFKTDTGELSMSEHLKKAYTTHVVKAHRDKIAELANCDFLPTLSQKAVEIRAFLNNGLASVFENTHTSYAQVTDSVKEHCAAVAELQLFIRDNQADSNAIALKAKQLFNFTTDQDAEKIQSACVLEEGIYDTHKELVEILEAAPLLGALGLKGPILSNYAAQQDLINYLQHKGITI